MTVLIYQEYEHPKGFVGARVVRTVGQEFRQRYFPFRNRTGNNFDFKSPSEIESLEKEARELDAKWKQDAERYRQNYIITHNHRRVKKLRETGVIGITLSFQRCRKNSKSKYYHYPVFRVTRQRLDKAQKQFYISKLGYRAAWEAAVMCWAQAQGVPDATARRIMASPPDPQQFRKLRQQMNREGHQIPIEALSKITKKRKI